MLQPLLDEQLSEHIVNAVRSMQTNMLITSIFTWQGGRYKGASDEDILRAAHAQGLTLVTFDQSTIAPVLRTWGQQGIPHAGVIFGSTRTVSTGDFGGIARALTRIWQRAGDLDWTDRVEYLVRV